MVLLRELLGAGIKIKSVITSKKPSEVQFNVDDIDFYSEISDEIIWGDLCFLCVPDDCISSVCRSIADLEKVSIKGVVHVSGALNSSELKSIRSENCQIASWHPMQTFVLDMQGVTFREIFVSIEGDEELCHQLKNITVKLGAFAEIITSDQKTALHLAGVIVSNFMSSLGIYANDVLLTSFPDWDKNKIQQVYGKLILQTANNIVNLGLPDSITGPAIRGDSGTIARHKQLLSKHGIDVTLYDILTSLIERYRE